MRKQGKSEANSLPYKQEVRGSSPRAPTIPKLIFACDFPLKLNVRNVASRIILKDSIVYNQPFIPIRQASFEEFIAAHPDYDYPSWGPYFYEIQTD